MAKKRYLVIQIQRRVVNIKIGTADVISLKIINAFSELVATKYLTKGNSRVVSKYNQRFK